jgi:solute carrier family 12 (potassium/chloride transporters), member 8
VSYWEKYTTSDLFGFSRPDQEYEQIVVPPKHPGMEVEAAQQNNENEDFASRSRYHHTSTVQGRLVTIDDDED